MSLFFKLSMSKLFIFQLVLNKDIVEALFSKPVSTKTLFSTLVLTNVFILQGGFDQGLCFPN